MAKRAAQPTPGRRALALGGVPVGDDLDAFAKDMADRIVRINAGRARRGFPPVVVREPDAPKMTTDRYGRLSATIVLDAKPMQDALARLTHDMERRIADALQAEVDEMVTRGGR